MLESLYQELILDHGRSPRNFGALENCDCEQVGHNPLCGDRLRVYVMFSGETIADIRFTGEGCAICMASASLMTQRVKGMTKSAALALFTLFRESIMEKRPLDEAHLGKLTSLLGVAQFPMRVKCATLAWHTLEATLSSDSSAPISTE